jgi:hypothetical protein
MSTIKVWTINLLVGMVFFTLPILSLLDIMCWILMGHRFSHINYLDALTDLVLFFNWCFIIIMVFSLLLKDALRAR